MRQREYRGISTGNTIRRSEVGIYRREGPKFYLTQHKFLFTSRKYNSRYITGYTNIPNMNIPKIRKTKTKKSFKRQRNNIENECLITLNEIKDEFFTQKRDQIKDIEMSFYLDTKDVKLCPFCEHKEREDNDESYIHKELDDVYEIYNKIRYEDDAIYLDEAYNEYEKNKEVSQE